MVLSTPAAAETIYVATLRNQPGVDVNSAGGALYAFDLAKGVSSVVAPIRIGGALPIGITGLAVHPKTGVFYGLTAGLAPNLPRSLITIDPTNGNATLIGRLGQAGSDIRFDPNGTLYVWLVDLNRLGTVDLGTGVVKPLDNPVYQQTLGGGIAINRDGLVYISANSSAGSLDTFDPATHKLTTGPNMTGAPFISSMNSMAFSENGTLYAVNSNLGTPAKTRLVSIDTKTGAVKEIAVLPDDVDPLAFAPGAQDRKPADDFTRWERWIYLVLAFGFGLAMGLLIARRRRV